MKRPKFILTVLPCITLVLFSNKTPEKAPQVRQVIKTDTFNMPLRTVLIKSDTQYNKSVPGFAIISAG